MEVIGFRVNTKVGSFDVINKEGALIVWSKGKALKSFTGINPADKDSIVEAIENSAEELQEAQKNVVTDKIPLNEASSVLHKLVETFNESLNKRDALFFTTRLNQMIAKLEKIS